MIQWRPAALFTANTHTYWFLCESRWLSSDVLTATAVMSTWLTWCQPWEEPPTELYTLFIHCICFLTTTWINMLSYVIYSLSYLQNNQTVYKTVQRPLRSFYSATTANQWKCNICTKAISSLHSCSGINSASQENIWHVYSTWLSPEQRCISSRMMTLSY